MLLLLPTITACRDVLQPRTPADCYRAPMQAGRVCEQRPSAAGQDSDPLRDRQRPGAIGRAIPMGKPCDTTFGHVRDYVWIVAVLHQSTSSISSKQCRKSSILLSLSTLKSHPGQNHPSQGEPASPNSPSRHRRKALRTRCQKYRETLRHALLRCRFGELGQSHSPG